jgi:hypothetical protein
MDRPDIRRIEAPEGDTPSSAAASRPKDWVDELIEMTRPGIDMALPDRGWIQRPPPFTFDDFS